MKKLIFALLSVYLLVFTVPVISVLAADTPENGPPAEASNVIITVVLPDEAEIPAAAQESEPVPAPESGIQSKTVLYPVDVSETRENGGWQIVKTYELTAADNPADIPCGGFERNGRMFTLTDIIKRETADAETKPHTETVTLSADSKELETILNLLAPAVDYKTDDGFAGILALDIASIKVETEDTQTSSYTMSVTREYPRLSSADISLVPKTVEERGKTYTLADVDWNSGNYESVDYTQLPEYYTATATYTAAGTSTKVTGYAVTAEYNGTLAKLSRGKTVYTAYFEGNEIWTPLEFTGAQSQAVPGEVPAEQLAPDPTALPDTESGSENTATALYVIIAFLILLLAGSAFYIIKNGKGQTKNEKTIDSAADAHYDADGGDSDDGGK